VVWVSDAARSAKGQRIRGGIPICWPWFGPADHAPGLGVHGFARDEAWEAPAVEPQAGGATRLHLRLPQRTAAHAGWPYSWSLDLYLTLGECLELELATVNRGAESFVLGEALHTYFRVGDIGAVHIEGLEGTEYVDKTQAGRRGRQAGAVHFTGEVDRVYESGADCVLVDPVLGRRIAITAQGAGSTVVWNPWEARASQLGDLGAGQRGQGGWREMVCIESGNALARRVRVEPGATHLLRARYAVQDL
jgi:D-hexose-6-phosphate mutarotase